jgi:hypothetical protein
LKQKQRGLTTNQLIQQLLSTPEKLMLVLISSHRHQKFVQPQKPKLDFLHQQAIKVMLGVIMAARIPI